MPWLLMADEVLGGRQNYDSIALHVSTSRRQVRKHALEDHSHIIHWMERDKIIKRCGFCCLGLHELSMPPISLLALGRSLSAVSQQVCGPMPHGVPVPLHMGLLSQIANNSCSGLALRLSWHLARIHKTSRSQQNLA